MRKVSYLLSKSIEVCSRCGKRILMCGYDTKSHIPAIMERDKVCFECAYWKEMAEFPKRNMEVTGVKCILLNPMVSDKIKKDKSVILGGRGRKRYFMRIDGTPVMSNDVWMVGEIPAPYRELFKRTVYEIKKTAFEMLGRFNRRCKAKQCYDRYQCLRYDISMEADGPANVIPKNWKGGNEKCPNFMNKAKYVID